VVLVRPDGVIAWRGTAAENSSAIEAELHAILNRLL
jgi:hypothetical protein